jgi:transmembrane sensor
MKLDRSTLQPAPAAIEDTAVDWAIRRAAGLTATETAELLRWLEADPRRAVALSAAEKTAGLLRRPRETGAAEMVLRELRARQTTRRTRRRVIAWTGAGLAAAASVAFVFLQNFRASRPETSAAPITVVVRPDRQTLPDGSVVHLNAGAEIRVAFTPGRRSVELLRGEALFSVTSDPARPFVVAAAGVEVRAVGTEFSVRHASADVDVLVTEGRVAVARNVGVLPEPDAASIPFAAVEPIYVAAGSRVSMPVVDVIPAAIPVQQVTLQEMASALAWRDRRVEFTGTPLSEAVALFNGENRTQVTFADPSLASVRISGVFWKDDPEAFAKLLEMSLGVSVERPSPDRIVLRRTN